MTMNKVNYGIVSTASIASRFVKAAKYTSNSNVLAVASRDRNRAREFAEKNGIETYYGDYEEIYKDERIDCVYVPLINSLHYPYAKKALLANKNVLVEKPMFLHADEVRELMKLAMERNLFISEAVKAPFLPVLKDVKKIVDDRTLGKLYLMEFKQSYTDSTYASGWNKERKSGGGVLYGNEAYFLTVLEMMAGKVREYTGLCTYTVYDVEDQISVSLITEKGVLANTITSTDTLMKNGLYMYFENGMIFVPDYWKSAVGYVYQNNELIQTIRHDTESEMKYEVEHYSSCILSGKTGSEVTPMKNSARYIQICEDLYHRWGRE